MLNRFRISAKLLNALTVLGIGLGLLIFLVGLLTDAYSWQMGLVVMVALWVIGFALRVFLVSKEE
jgi:hypothetical protein